MGDPRKQVEDQLHEVHHNLYNLTVQTTAHAGPPTEEAMKKELRSLTGNLHTLSSLAPTWPIQITDGLVRIVEEGRNPDIHQREFVEKTQELNQRLKGRSEAFSKFRDILATKFAAQVPEVRDGVKTVVEGTGGKFEG